LEEPDTIDGEEPVERRFLGMVEVDSGTLLVGDPLYCLPEAALERSGIDYAAVIDAPNEAASHLDEKPVLLLGRFGGDGTFPVFGEFDGGELLRVTIEFIDPPEDK
jgi:hypothetical protein